MEIKFHRASVINIDKNNKNSDLLSNNKTKYTRNSLKLNFVNKGDILFNIRDKLIKAYLKKEKIFENKAGNIIKNNKNIYSNKAQYNYYNMFITNLTSEKSHRIRLNYTERLLEINDEEILIKCYRRHECYTKFRLIINNKYQNNIYIFPKFPANEIVISIIEKNFKLKEKLILKTENHNKLDKLNYPPIKNKINDRYKEISNKFFESSIEDNKISIDLENNLKNLNNENSSKSSINESNSSIKFKNLINNLNNKNIMPKKEIPKKNAKNMIKLKTKIFKLKINNIVNNNDNKEFKRFNSQTKPISFDTKKMIQKLYLDDFLLKKFSQDKKKIANKNLKNNKNNNIALLKKFRNKKLYLETFSDQQKNHINLLNINSYNSKNSSQDRKFSLNFRSTDLFLNEYLKDLNDKNLERTKNVKNTIINSIKEYEAFKSKNIISFLKLKEKALINNFNLSVPKKITNKNFVQRDGFTTEITNIQDLINKQKLKVEKSLQIKDKSNKDFLRAAGLFYYNNNSKFIKSESMTERIKLNIRKLLKNKRYKYMLSLLDNKY